jgi:hypothetical protein
MHKLVPAAVVAALLAATPLAHAGDFFVNGQAGRIDMDGDDFDGDESSLQQASAGYRWGIGMAQVGIEGGLGRLGEREDSTQSTSPGGTIDNNYQLASRYGFVGLNARIKPPAIPLYAIGRAGYIGMRHELESTSIDSPVGGPPVTQRSTFDRTDGGTYVGVGVGTTILPMLDVGLMVNQYNVAQVEYDTVEDEYRLSGDKRDARSVSLMLEYRF